MASVYGILTVTDLNSSLKTVTLESIVDKDSNRVFTEAIIDKAITNAERRVFSQIKQTYALADIPDNVLLAIDKLATQDMRNACIEIGQIEETSTVKHIDLEEYYEIYVLPLIKENEEDNVMLNAYSISDSDY